MDIMVQDGLRDDASPPSVSLTCLSEARDTVHPAPRGACVGWWSVFTIASWSEGLGVLQTLRGVSADRQASSLRSGRGGSGGVHNGQQKV